MVLTSFKNCSCVVKKASTEAVDNGLPDICALIMVLAK